MPNIKIEIRREEDGEVRSTVWKDSVFSEFWWSEGNGSCDCNRELFFLRAKGEDEPDEVQCGEERFCVRVSDADTGEVFYAEF